MSAGQLHLQSTVVVGFLFQAMGLERAVGLQQGRNY